MGIHIFIRRTRGDQMQGVNAFPLCSMSSKPTAPSLQSIALRAVLRKYVNSKHIVDIMRLFEKMDWMIEQGPMLKEQCVEFIKRTFSGLMRRYDRVVLQELLGDENLSTLEAQMAETQKTIARSKITGRVVEREPAVCSESDGIQPKLTRSVSGNGHQIECIYSCDVLGKTAYSYEALKEGRSWPSDVSVSNREEHLDNDEFHEVFSVSYDTYCAYPAWKRNRIKKEKHLF